MLNSLSSKTDFLSRVCQLHERNHRSPRHPGRNQQVTLKFCVSCPLSLDWLGVPFSISNPSALFGSLFVCLLIFGYLFRLPWVLVVVHVIFIVSCELFHCSTQTLWLSSTGSVVVAHRLCCPMACGILVSQPGIKPMTSALQDGLLTTGPPRKSPLCPI